MLIERSERGGERRKEWNGREKRERRGGRKSARVWKRKRAEEKLEGGEERTGENTRPRSGGLCEGYEGWCKGDGEAGGSASDGESQRLTKKKGRPLQFIDRPAVQAATRGVK